MPDTPATNGPSPPTAPATGATQRLVDPRTALVDRSREQWLRRLVDHSRNNQLLYYRDLRAGTLDLTHAQPALLAQFLSGGAVRVDRLLPPTEGASPSAKARHIQQRARANRDEKGIATLFVALGLATWRIGDAGRPPAAPIVLIPATLELHSRVGPLLTLERSGEAQISRVLLDQLEQSFACRIDPQTLLDDDVEHVDDLQTVFEYLRGAAREVAGFGVDQRIVLGNFSYLKLAIVQDLRQCGDLLAQHDVVAAMAGDGGALAALRRNRASIEPELLDRIPPDDEFAILDADSSQQRAIVAVLDGQHGVIQGPPGTGKSQTIANLIASLVANGKRVLFVAEKRAALEVVLERLERAGLGHLALDMHGADVSRSQVVRRIAGNLERLRSAAPVDATAVHREFAARREQLNRHVQELHRPRAPWGVSLYELQGRLLRLPATTHTPVRWRNEQIVRLDQAEVARLGARLVELGTFAALFHGADATPWARARIGSGSEAQAAVDLVGGLLGELDALRAVLDQVPPTTGLPLPHTLAAADELLWLLERTRLVLDTYDRQIWQRAAGLAERTAAGRTGVMQASWALLSDGGFREAFAQANALRHERLRYTGAQTLAGELGHAAYIAELWQRVVPGREPRAFPKMGQLRERLAACRAGLEQLQPVLAIDPTLSLDRLTERCGALLGDSRAAFRVARMNELQGELRSWDLAPLLDRLAEPGLPPELWPLCFEHAWLSSVLEQLLAEDTALAAFNGAAHSGVAREFGARDRERLAIAAERVRRAHAEAVIAAMNAHPDQEDLVRREAAKRKRHLPIRALLARAPEVLTAVCPCWMASPLSVSQLIDARQARFDVVIFDEASQVLPEDAVAAILRGKQVVVAGDRYQLPPTRFFVAGEDDEQDAADPALSEGFESVLDLLGAQLEPWSLLWHYRSRDEALIAFSNRHTYNGRLITFPAAGASQALTHVLVPWQPEGDGQYDSASAEVTRVVELILEHAARRPHSSLGVIAMGITHAQRIEAELDRALRQHGDASLDAFFSLEGSEPFFVKNLERVQGDERDAIILSVGYGKDRSGRLPYRFGPLLTSGGERRLNVAVTRARSRLTLVSSFSHLDMDPSRSQARGVELLRAYLEYAAGGGQRLSNTGAAAPLEPLRADVYDALTARDVPLVAQWGFSSYRLDFAARHPRRPEQFVLALECDGEMYRSAPTARDRDRLRQQQLEALGWQFCRIWSTDWFEHRDEQIERVVGAYQAAVAAADAAAEVTATPATVELPAHAPATGDTQVLSTRQAMLHRRAARPEVGAGRPITQYSPDELAAMLRWVESDGILRSDDELVAELVHELGFSRRGPRIEATLRQAIDAVRSGRQRS